MMNIEKLNALLGMLINDGETEVENVHSCSYDDNIIEGDIGYEEKYFNHILETTARKWSIDRLNFISGESWIYA